MALNLKRSSNFILIEANNGHLTQDRKVSEGMASEVKVFLNDAKAFYENIASLEENCSEIEKTYCVFRSDKTSILQEIQYNYINELNFLRDIGGDVSNYPKYLSKLNFPRDIEIIHNIFSN